MADDYSFYEEHEPEQLEDEFWDELALDSAWVQLWSTSCYDAA